MINNNNIINYDNIIDNNNTNNNIDNVDDDNDNNNGDCDGWEIIDKSRRKNKNVIK